MHEEKGKIRVFRLSMLLDRVDHSIRDPEKNG
jgi:hypothetical protein